MQRRPIPSVTSSVYWAVEVQCYHTLFVCRTFPVSETKFMPGHISFSTVTCPGFFHRTCYRAKLQYFTMVVERIKPLPPTIRIYRAEDLNSDGGMHSRLNVINPYPTAFPYGNGMVLHFYQQQESSTTKTVHKVINKGLKTYV